MSTYYYIYTEVNVNGKWFCINNKIDTQKEGEKLSYTYFNGSSSCFRATAEKIEEIGNIVKYDDLSAELQERFKWAENDIEQGNVFAVTPDAMYDSFPEDHTLSEFCGYVHKNILFDYQTGEIDDIYESISDDEYIAMPEAKKKCYLYYEWDSAFGWYKHFKKILEHFQWQKYEWEAVNSFYDRETEFRLVLVKA